MTELKIKDFILVVTLILFLLIYFKTKIFLSAVGIGIVVIGIVFSFIFKPLAFIWYRGSEFIGCIMSKIILSILFFVILTPIACIVRIFKKDILGLTFFNSKKTSFFINRVKNFNAQDLIYPF